MKKIISLISTVALMLTMAVSVSAAAAEPTMSLEVSGGTKAGETVTVVCKYDGMNVTPYNDDEGSGHKYTSAQVRINIPGGIGTASDNEQFLRGGVTNTSGFETGSSTWNWDKDANTFTAVLTNVMDPANTSGTVFTITMKLNKDITDDLAFTFNTDYSTKMYYDPYEDWECGDFIAVESWKYDLSNATLAAPKADPKAEIAANGKVTFENIENTTIGSNKQLVLKNANIDGSTLTNTDKIKITYNETDSKISDKTLFELLGIEATSGATATGKNIRIGVKADSTLDASLFAFDIVK